MKTVQILGCRQASLIDKPMPSVRGSYVRIEIRAAPMCNEYLAYRDLVFLERNRPDSLGHEIAGVVVEAPAGASVDLGQRVVALCGFPCGRCEVCSDGYYSHCPQPDDPLDVCASPSGECGFARYAIKPDWLLLPIPHDMSYEHASMACCGLGPTFGAMQRMQVGAGSTVLITGLGAVGLGGVLNAKFRGATVISVVRSPYRAEIARKLGSDHVLDPGDGDVRERVLEITQGRGVDHAIECSGHAEYQRLAIDALRRLGSATFLAEPGEIVVRIDEDLVQRGVMLLGSLDINRRDGDALLQVIGAMPEQIDAFITHRFPLSDIAAAFEKQIGYECGKIVLDPWA
jgi:threonine dehydrogenase-like Zn-dependent dehydrogenase